MSYLRDRATMRRNILAHLQKFVYGPFDDFYNRELTEIVEANDALIGGRLYQFRHLGTIYTVPGIILKGPRGKVWPLAASLVPRFEAILAEKQQIDRDERPYVTNYLHKVLSAGDSTVEILASLPSVLRRPFADFMRDHNVEAKELSIDETGEAAGACEKSLALLKQRLMLNLLLGDR